MAYNPPPLRRDTFRDQYLANRRGNVGTVTSVDTPYGENLASRDWKGDPIARNGDGGSDMMSTAMAQLSQDNAPPYSSPIPVVSPYGAVGYTRQPFSPLTGQTNWVPGGTVSSTLPDSTVQQIPPTPTINGVPASNYGPPVMNGVPQVDGQPEVGAPIIQPLDQNAPTIPPAGTPGTISANIPTATVPVPPIVQPASSSPDAYLTPIQQIQAQQWQQSRAFQDPNSPQAQTPAYQQWVDDQNDQRASPIQPSGLPKQPLGPMDQALAQLTSDDQTQEDNRVVAEQLKNSLMRADRLGRESQGRRGPDGRMIATRTTGVSPAYDAVRDKQIRDLYTQIQSGASPDVIAKQYDNLVRGSAAGAAVPMTVEQLSRQQSAADAQKRLQLYQQEADRRSLEFKQKQADTFKRQAAITAFANAKDDSERRKIIQENPEILGTPGGRALTRQTGDGDLNRVDYQTFAHNRDALQAIRPDRRTSQQNSELDFLNDQINRYVQQEQQRGGSQPSTIVTPPVAASPAPSTINPAIPYQAVQYLKDHPETIDHFDQTFGKGAAAKVLGK